MTSKKKFKALRVATLSIISAALTYLSFPTAWTIQERLAPHERFTEATKRELLEDIVNEGISTESLEGIEVIAGATKLGAEYIVSKDKRLIKINRIDPSLVAGGIGYNVYDSLDDTGKERFHKKLEIYLNKISLLKNLMREEFFQGNKKYINNNGAFIPWSLMGVEDESMNQISDREFYAVLYAHKHFPEVKPFTRENRDAARQTQGFSDFQDYWENSFNSAGNNLIVPKMVNLEDYPTWEHLRDNIRRFNEAIGRKYLKSQNH